MKSSTYYSHGKLLITGEYLVLDGALALALPVISGQSLLVEEGKSEELHWIARHPDETWFEASMSLPALEIKLSSDPEIAASLVKLLSAACTLQPDFLTEIQSLKVTTHLEFRREWGFGSSSTLITNVARWAGVDPYKLLWMVSKGSGYDIACAEAAGPILYRLADQQPVVTPVRFNPSFSDSIYFVYLGRKMDSDAGISAYRQRNKSRQMSLLVEISTITEAVLSARSLEEFTFLIEEHEAILSRLLGVAAIGKTVFNDFPGQAKSLGAWGGDFAMLASNIGKDEVKKLLKKRGLQTFFHFDQLILKHPEDQL